MARKRKTAPASPPVPASVEAQAMPGLVRVVFTAEHDIDGERVATGTERPVDEVTAASLIARRCARMA